MLDIAIQLMKENKDEEARNILIKLIETYPDDADVQFYCASAHDGLGLESEAIPYYEKAISLGIEGSNREKVFVQLGSSQRCIGEYEAALRTLEKGLLEFPENRAIQTFCL
ncbi:tol-pal system YbgF family protein [Bacillus sp. CGMCC 1.16607]|uniref:tetratricopeptide repeat protein n=1 Tax=Bacillus sp. CGMCC 1.16607 TaxID=3351842 RepID=UPI003630A391